MPITAAPSPTTNSAFSPMGMFGGNMPNLNLPTIANANTNPAPAWGSSDIYKTLTQGAPQSLTNMIGPLLQQVFGTQGNIMQPLFQQMTNQNVASAQSDAMQRGLTGSSIEAASMGQARQGGSDAFSQYLAGQLNNLVPSIMGAGQFDITNQGNYYNNIAQAIGQQMAQQIQQQQFQNMINSQPRGPSDFMQGLGMASQLGGQLGAAYLSSDIRLKENVTPLGRWHGMTWYSFEYKQDTPFDLPKGLRVGLMGHEVYKHRPDCVTLKDGYFMVDYGKLLEIYKFKEFNA